MPEIGQNLSHYSITGNIGKGGMGEVFRAKDQKLGRDVAIKVLPEEFARDADRVARFQREAKLLASLNHPNIAAIYGLESSDKTSFLVLELVEGDTLADRIKAGRIPVEESLKLALQIAEALEAAHEKGVTLWISIRFADKLKKSLSGLCQMELRRTLWRSSTSGRAAVPSRRRDSTTGANHGRLWTIGTVVPCSACIRRTSCKNERY